MLPTYEAILQPDGRLQFVDLPAAQAQAPRHVLVTFTDAPVTLDRAPGDQPLSGASSADWHTHVGVLKDSPHWQGDPLAIQQDLRREWD